MMLVPPRHDMRRSRLISHTPQVGRIEGVRALRVLGRVPFPPHVLPRLGLRVALLLADFLRQIRAQTIVMHPASELVCGLIRVTSYWEPPKNRLGGRNMSFGNGSRSAGLLAITGSHRRPVHHPCHSSARSGISL